jgi:hypothetical protein
MTKRKKRRRRRRRRTPKWRKVMGEEMGPVTGTSSGEPGSGRTRGLAGLRSHLRCVFASTLQRWNVADAVGGKLRWIRVLVHGCSS